MSAAVSSPIPPERGTRDWSALALGSAVVVVAIAFLIYPLAHAMLLAFVKNGEEPALASLTLANFSRFFIAASYKRALWNSVYSGLAATLLATLIALPMAFAVARIAMPFRGLISAMSVVPLISPPFIGAYAWIILLGRNGIVTQLVQQWTGLTLPSIYGPPGVILALALSYFPYVFLIVQGALAAADPHIEEAARMAGAGRARILATITFPLVIPAIGAAMLIVFIKAVGDFGVPSILGGEFQVLPTLIYYQIHGYLQPERRVGDRRGQRAADALRDGGAGVGQPQAQFRNGRRHLGRCRSPRESRRACVRQRLLLARHLRRDPAAARDRARVVRGAVAGDPAARELYRSITTGPSGRN